MMRHHFLTFILVGSVVFLGFSLSEFDARRMPHPFTISLDAKNIYANGRIYPVLNQTCGSLDGTLIDSSGPIRSFNGWSYDHRTDSHPIYIIFIRSGEVVDATMINNPRPDVAEAFNGRGLQSGFHMNRPIHADPAEVEFTALGIFQSGYSCPLRVNKK